MYPHHSATEQGEFLYNLNGCNVSRESRNVQLLNWVINEMFYGVICTGVM
jgi:hypothetical protein